MVAPVPSQPDITTEYWKAGSAWSCGHHDGVDFAAPAGSDVVAMWGGTVVEAAYPTSFGPAFGRAVVIDHDKLPDGSPGYWGLYAHLSAENVSVGQRVEVGQKIGDVGTTGNSTGNHLHVGIYEQPSWKSCGGINPQPWIDAGTELPPGPVYLSKLHYGQEDSDSVKRLQQALNAHPLAGGEQLPVTGNYLEQTDEEVRLCQEQHGYGNDPAGGSSVGPDQAGHLFAGTGDTIVNDLPEPEEPPDPEPEPPDSLVLPLGIEYHYSGKPAGTFTFSDAYKRLDVPSWAPAKDGLTLGMLYANVDGSGEFRVRLVRESPDDQTAYQTFYPKSGDNLLVTHVWFESGEGGRGLHWEMQTMDGETMTVGTRYAKFVTIPWDVTVAAAQAGVAYQRYRWPLVAVLGLLALLGIAGVAS